MFYYSFLFSIESLKWEGLSSGAFPPRYEHATFVVGRDRCSTLYSFAGADQNGSLNDMWKFEKGTHMHIILCVYTIIRSE